MRYFRLLLRAINSPVGYLGLFLVSGKGVWKVIEAASNVDFIAGVAGSVGAFLDTGWGTAATVLLGAALIVFALYRVSPPQTEPTTAPAPARDRESTIDEFDVVYEDEHESLMLFVVDHLLPTCGEMSSLRDEIIKSICQNKEIARLAARGASEQSSVFNIACNDLLGLYTSPPRFVPRDAMVNAVDQIERNYRAELDHIRDMAAEAGYKVFSPETEPQMKRWMVAHTRMVEAYETIKKDSRLGKLFRPSRPSRWGAAEL